MLMDWKAASERHPGGMNIVRSVEVSSERFSVGEQLKKIFAEHGEGDRLDLISDLVIQ
jgi:hypothetical protein